MLLERKINVGDIGQVPGTRLVILFAQREKRTNTFYTPTATLIATKQYFYDKKQTKKLRQCRKNIPKTVLSNCTDST